MRKIILSLCSVIIALVCVFSGSTQAQASSKYTPTISSQITLNIGQVKQTIVDFVYGEEAIASNDFTDGIRVDRTSASDQEKAAAEYLYGELKNILGAQECELEDLSNARILNQIAYQNFEFSQNYGSSQKSQNIIGLLTPTTPTNKIVIVGAHYDNYYNFAVDLFGKTPSKSHGIYDNAGGVAALLHTAKIMQTYKDSIDYNVMFVLYGAEEMGMVGSNCFMQYIDNIKAKKDILLALNFDSIGVGDEMYMYCDEVSTIHEDYIKSVADALYNDYNEEYFNLPPKYKRVAYMSSTNKFGYTHMGLASDNVSYVANGINAVTFFSGDWNNSAKLGAVVESSKHDNINHTNNDTLNGVEELYGDLFYQRIVSTVKLACNTLIQSDFSKTMIESSKSKSNYQFFVRPMTIKLILVGVVAVCYTAFMLIIKKHKPQKVEVSVAQSNPDLEKIKQAVLNNTLSELDDNKVEENLKDEDQENIEE